MFICHKCGYKDMSDKEKTSCPICGANIIVPKGALILFLSLISFIVFCIISVFNDRFNFLAITSIIIAFISLPLAIMEAVDNKAQNRIENTNNAKTRAKYQKLYKTHTDNFNKALAEKYKRGLDGKGW